MKIKEALIEGRDYLKDLEYTDPIYETRRILSDLLNKDLSYLVSHDEDLLDSKIENKYFKILEKRQKGIPLQYILGEEDFYGRTFKVIEGVLIPRQDTEISVEKILNVIENNQINNMLEIGCGTGLELASIYRKFPNVQITGIDLSKEMMSKLKEKYSDKNIDLILADYFEYPFEQEKYDAALSFETLHHFKYQKKQKIYKKLFQTIKPGGYYVECDLYCLLFRGRNNLS